MLALLGELILVGAALLAVSVLLSLPKGLYWTYSFGLPIPHMTGPGGSPPMLMGANGRMLPVQGPGLWTAVGQLWQPLLHGSLGVSGGRLVSHALPAPAWHSLALLLAGFVLAILLGVLKGLWDFSSLRRRRFSLLPAVTALMQGLPDYWLILLCQWGVVALIAKHIHVPLLVGYDEKHPVQSMLFPLLIIALIPAGAIAHITGEALLDVVGSDAVRTARAKGLPDLVVLWRHALRLALVEVLDALPAVLSMMLTNLVVVETLTAYPGLGRLLVGALRVSTVAAIKVDSPTAFAAALVLLSTFFVLLEVLRAVRRLVDPRLREEVRQ